MAAAVHSPRVKVYLLNLDGYWDDRGTGLVTVEYVRESEVVRLVVVNENALDNPATPPSLNHLITKDISYQRQGDDTIITWTDASLGTDVALSFQEARGCNYIWEQIQHIQSSEGAAPAFGPQPQPGSPQQQHEQHALHEGPPGPYMRRRPGGGGGGSAMIDEFEQVTAHLEELHSHPDVGPLSCAAGGPGGGGPGGPGGHEVLPDPPELSNLEAIARGLAEVSLFQRDRMAAQLCRPGYLAKLLDLFRVAEDLENDHTLQLLYSIMKSAILLNETNLLELLFCDEYVMDVIGALEYEPDVPANLRPRHREFLRDKVVFKEVVPISDRSVVAKIHQSYRLGYVKDVVLPRVLDDATFATLSSLVLFNNVEIVMSLHQDPSFFPTLFQKLRQAAPGRRQQQQQQRGEGGGAAAAAAAAGGDGGGNEEWRDLVAFLQELCGLTKHLQATQRNALLHKLADLGLFEVMSDVMRYGDQELQLRAVDVLLADVHHDPAQLRVFLTRQLKAGEEGALFGLLMQALVSRSCGGLQEAILEMLRVLLDPETMEGAVEKNEFLEVFYDRFIGKLVGALVEAAEKPDAPSSITPATVALIVELLCFCVSAHSYRIKYYILRNNVVEKVLKLLRRRERWLNAAAVRFLRTCLGMKDEFYNRYLVKNNLMEPVVRAFLDNGPRYNLLNSAILEMMDFIRKENMKGLVSSVMERHEEELAAVDYCDTFRLLRAKWEQNQEREQHRVQQRDGGGAAGPAAGPAAAAEPPGGGLVGARPAPPSARERRVDRDEEDYFREDSDDEEPQQQPGGPPDSSNGRVVIEAASPLPGLLGSLVDYDDEDEDSLLPASRGGPPKRTPAAGDDRPGSPPLQKRFRLGPLLQQAVLGPGGLVGGSGSSGGGGGGGGAPPGEGGSGSGGEGGSCSGGEGGSSSKWDSQEKRGGPSQAGAG